MAQQIKKGYVNTNGIDMYYEIHGEGSMPLVLIHGGGSTIYTTFGRLLPEFAKHRRVIAVELQAHGHTEDRGVPSTFEQDADDVAALINALNLDKADILGFSNGGNTALQVAIRHPQLVNKVVAASAFYKRSGMNPWFWDFMKDAKLDFMPKPLQDAFLAINPNQEALQLMHDRDAVRMQTFTDWPDESLKAIQAPTLLLFGDADVMTPEHGIEMFRLIPNAKLSILPGSHGDYIGEVMETNSSSKMPLITAAIIEEFLDT